MSKFNKGDRVRVTNHSSFRYREIGTVESTSGHVVHVLMDSGRRLRGNEWFLELFDERIDLEADHNNGIEKLMRPADDDEMQNDVLGEQFDLDCIERLGAALTHVPDVPHVAPDAVHSPSHYTSDPSGIECIQITRHRNFNIGNAIKYLWRAGLKQDAGKTAQDKQIQDLEKSVWYIQDEIQRLKEASNGR